MEDRLADTTISEVGAKGTVAAMKVDALEKSLAPIVFKATTAN